MGAKVHVTGIWDPGLIEGLGFVEGSRIWAQGWGSFVSETGLVGDETNPKPYMVVSQNKATLFVWGPPKGTPNFGKPLFPWS